MFERQNGVGANLAVGGFVHEALARDRVDCKPEAGGVLHIVNGNTEAVFVGARHRKTLNPVHLRHAGTDHLRARRRVARCADVIGRFNGGIKPGIE